MNARATMKELVLPFKILVSPLKTFSQLAQNPSLIGLASLSALVLILAATALYAFASKIILNIDGPTSFLATGLFNGWYTSTLASNLFYIVLYWIIFASGLVLISRIVGGGKETSWRALLIVFGYLLSVFIILYAVRTVLYLALPSLNLRISSWPPVGETEVNDALKVMTETWGALYAYQFLSYFPLVAFVWLVMLRETSWTKAVTVSVIGFAITLFLFGPP
jgi:hypothetical protein